MGKDRLILKLIFGLLLFVKGLIRPDPFGHWAWMIVGSVGFVLTLYALMRDAPEEPPPTQITTRGATILALGVFAMPFLIVVPVIFFKGDKLAHRCSFQNEPASTIEACKEILRSRKLTPDALSKVYTNIGAAHYRKRDYDLALEDFEWAIGLNSHNPLAYLMRGATYLRKRQYQHALQDFDYVMTLGPKNTVDFKVAALIGRCDTHNILGQRDFALNECNHALALSSSNVDVLDTRGFVYLKAGNYVAARTDFDAAIKLNRKQATSLYGRGLIKRRVGDIVGADEDIAAAIKLNPDVANDVAFYDLGGMGEK